MEVGHALTRLTMLQVTKGSIEQVLKKVLPGSFTGHDLKFEFGLGKLENKWKEYPINTTFPEIDG